jgi:hypothetical protein
MVPSGPSGGRQRRRHGSAAGDEEQRPAAGGEGEANGLAILRLAGIGAACLLEQRHLARHGKGFEAEAERHAGGVEQRHALPQRQPAPRWIPSPGC